MPIDDHLKSLIQQKNIAPKIEENMSTEDLWNALSLWMEKTWIPFCIDGLKEGALYESFKRIMLEELFDLNKQFFISYTHDSVKYKNYERIVGDEILHFNEAVLNESDITCFKTTKRFFINLFIECNQEYAWFDLGIRDRTAPTDFQCNNESSISTSKEDFDYINETLDHYHYKALTDFNSQKQYEDHIISFLLKQKFNIGSYPNLTINISPNTMEDDYKELVELVALNKYSQITLLKKNELVFIYSSQSGIELHHDFLNNHIINNIEIVHDCLNNQEKLPKFESQNNKTRAQHFLTSFEKLVQETLSENPIVIAYDTKSPLYPFGKSGFKAFLRYLDDAYYMKMQSDPFHEGFNLKLPAHTHNELIAGIIKIERAC